MISRSERRCFSSWGRLALAAIAVMVLLSGCGGGGGGGGGGGSTPSGVVSITGVLQDKTTLTLLQNRTVTVEGTSLQGTSNTQGQFTIANVPITTIKLDVKDSVGSSDGSSQAINLSKLSGNPRNVGTIVLDLSSIPGLPPV